jgi:hypothetical protein
MTDENAGGPLAIMLESVVVLLVGGTAFGGDGDSTTVFGVLAVVAAGCGAATTSRRARGCRAAHNLLMVS